MLRTFFTLTRSFSTLPPRPHITAQVFSSPGHPFELHQFAPPQLGPGDLLVAIELATICGSDLHTIKGQRQEPTPLILGHEAVGRVVEVGGADPENLDANRTARARAEALMHERVTWSVADSCHTCASCTVWDLPQKCTSLFKYGHASLSNGPSGLNGGFASHVVVRRGTHVVPVPEHLPASVVAPANCALATVMNVLESQRRVEEGRKGQPRTAVVQGAGLLGLYACAVLKARDGFDAVFCVDISEERLQLAQQFGAIPLSGEGTSEAEEQRARAIREVTPQGVDLVVEVAGVPEVVKQGVDLVRPGGEIVLAGLVHPNSLLSDVSAEQIIRKCATVRGVHNYAGRHLDQSIEFLSEHHEAFPFESLVSQPYALRDLEQAVEVAHTDRRFARISIDPSLG